MRVTQQSATSLAQSIRNGERRAVAVVDAHIHEVKRVNGAINALVEDRFSAARLEAERADERVRSAHPDDELPPLLGVPFSVKQAFQLEGMTHASGSLMRETVRAQKTSTCVQRLIDAGAIPLGVTNVPELAMWMETDNRLFGRTQNPYDLSRTAGGSSGGEGALIGAGAVPFGVGSDTGGSIRLPAFFCGVFGHKPSRARVPGTGHHPAPEAGAGRYVTFGPLARRAEDLEMLLGLMEGEDGVDVNADDRAHLSPLSASRLTGRMSNANGNSLKLDATTAQHLKVLVVQDRPKVAAAVDHAERRAAAALARRGARLEAMSLRGTRQGFRIWGDALRASNEPPFSIALGGGTAVKSGRTFVKTLLRRGPHTLPAAGLALLDDLGRVFPGLVKGGVALAEEMAEAIDAALGDHGVLLFPTYPRPAPKHGAPLLRPLDFATCGMWNVLGHPVTQVPAGLSRAGLPVGIQVIAKRGHDALALQVARLLEQDLGGWLPPPRMRRLP